MQRKCHYGPNHLLTILFAVHFRTWFRIFVRAERFGGRKGELIPSSRAVERKEEEGWVSTITMTKNGRVPAVRENAHKDPSSTFRRFGRGVGGLRVHAVLGVLLFVAPTRATWVQTHDINNWTNPAVITVSLCLQVHCSHYFALDNNPSWVPMPRKMKSLTIKLSCALHKSSAREHARVAHDPALFNLDRSGTPGLRAYFCGRERYFRREKACC